VLLTVLDGTLDIYVTHLDRVLPFQQMPHMVGVCHSYLYEKYQPIFG
jgi:hypothetical protein